VDSYQRRLLLEDLEDWMRICENASFRIKIERMLDGEHEINYAK